MNEAPFSFEPSAEPEPQPVPHIIWPEGVTSDREEQLPPEENEEFDAILKMLSRAKKAGMEVEVVAWYVQERIDGNSPHAAAAFALYEWDC